MRTTIPTTFRVANRKWTVVFDPDLDEGCDGETRYEKAEVALRPGLDKTYTEHTFLHELVHVMFGALGWEDDNADEGAVDSLAGLIHQFLQTKSGNIHTSKD